MSELTQEALVQIAHQHYPTGFPVEKDDYSQPLLAHQRTPEHQRWRMAWERALAWEEWRTLIRELPLSFSSYAVGVGTQPFGSACLRCFVYRKESLPGEETFVTRIAAAVSVLAPLYTIYVTTQVWHATSTSYARPSAAEGEGEAEESEAHRLYRSSRPQLAFEFPSTVKAEADRLARLVERVLGCRPFPLALAQVPMPDIRVGFFTGERPPTLLDALFSDNLENLP
jgi:hypothetical protein